MFQGSVGRCRFIVIGHAFDVEVIGRLGGAEPYYTALRHFEDGEEGRYDEALIVVPRQFHKGHLPVPVELFQHKSALLLDGIIDGFEGENRRFGHFG